ncbi:MAG: hypothetical protein CL694_09825 [Chloroflexi bacterium]|nr:hypothetical protein [Chloroflexota bacterium]
MKFGLKLHHSGPGASPDHMLRWARFAETLGMHLLMTADHVALTPDVLPQYPAPYYEPFTNLAWLAGHTDKIMLGTTVIVVPYRHPLLLAQITANIDQLSNGRLIFGIGAGWSVSEYEAFGIPHNKRGAITDDYLAAVKALWTQDVASHDGPYAKFRDVMLSPKPVQKPHPPIWVGGSGYLRGKMPAMDRRFDSVTHGTSWASAPTGCETKPCPSFAASPKKLASQPPLSARESSAASPIRHCRKTTASPVKEPWIRSGPTSISWRSWAPSTCCSTQSETTKRPTLQGTTRMPGAWSPPSPKKPSTWRTRRCDNPRPGAADGMARTGIWPSVATHPEQIARFRHSILRLRISARLTGRRDTQGPC